MDVMQSIAQEYMKKNIPAFNVGDTVKVHIKIKEGSRERIQIFEGFVLKKQHGGISETFTVRRIASGVGVEKTFPIHSPLIEKIQVVRKGDVRRAKLNYMRDRTGKSARIKSREYDEALDAALEVEAEQPVAPAEEPKAEAPAEATAAEAVTSETETTEAVETPVEAQAEPEAAPAEAEKPKAEAEAPEVVTSEAETAEAVETPVEAQAEPEAETKEAEEPKAEAVAEESEAEKTEEEKAE